MTGLTRITAAAALTFALTACSGDDSSGPAAEERSPEDVVAAAAATLTDTSGVQLVLSTDDLPDGINAIQKAVGVATDAPAFEGTLTVLLTGQAFEVPVIAVDDQVFAQIPLTPGWSPVGWRVISARSARSSSRAWVSMATAAASTCRERPAARVKS